MPFVKVKADDPRAQLLAYITDGHRLYQIVDEARGTLTLENCDTGFRCTIARVAIWTYRLVKRGPEVPAAPEEVSN